MNAAQRVSSGTLDAFIESRKSADKVILLGHNEALSVGLSDHQRSTSEMRPTFAALKFHMPPSLRASEMPISLWQVESPDLSNKSQRLSCPQWRSGRSEPGGLALSRPCRYKVAYHIAHLPTMQIVAVLRELYWSGPRSIVTLPLSTLVP
jgi:hypothetical protein